MRSFIIPLENSPTIEEDIASGIIPIEAEFEGYFPGENRQIGISYGNIGKKVQFEFREGKSHRLLVGRAFMINLNLTSSSQLKFLEVAPKTHFYIQVINKPM
jgi:hypothetical protein